jgi:hypothetical protein
MVMSPAELGPLAWPSSICKLLTSPLVREGVPHQQNLQLPDGNKNLVMGPRCAHDTKTDWPTDRRS